MQDRQNPSHAAIPVGSGFGAAVLIGIVLIGMFLDLPGLRGTVVGGVQSGCCSGWP